MTYFNNKIMLFSNKFIKQAAEEVFLTYPRLPIAIQLTTDPVKNHEKRLELATWLINEGG